MIDQYAFFESGVESIEFPSTLEVIEDSAFSTCVDLQYVKFPESIKQIETYSFFGCGLRDLTVPDTIKII